MTMTREIPPHVAHRIAEDIAKRVPKVADKVTPEAVEAVITGNVPATFSLPFGVPAMIIREAAEYGIEVDDL